MDPESTTCGVSMLSLNGWQRIGVVLSGLWILFVAVLVLNEFTSTPSRFPHTGNFVVWHLGLGFLQNDPDFQRLSPEARSIVVDRLSAQDAEFGKLPLEAQKIVKERLMQNRIPQARTPDVDDPAYLRGLQFTRIAA